MDGRALRRRNAGLGAGLVILAMAVAYKTATITVGFSYDNVGPRAFPYIIAAGLFLSGVSIFLGARSVAEEARPREPHDWISIAVISATLLMQMFLIRPLGWIPVATVSFATVAWAFGGRRIVLNLLFGAALATATFVLFNYGLGLRLPAGSLITGTR